MQEIIRHGLTSKQVIENEKKYGNNVIEKTANNSFTHLLLESLGDPMIKILIIALTIKIFFLIKNTDWYETIGIVIAIFLASLISTISEYGSEKAFARMQEEASKIKCKVKRNNKITAINVDAIVMQDLVILEAGDKIPSDGILVKGNIKVNESMLTGEAKEAKKESNNSLTNIKDTNKLYKGTIVTEGIGEMFTTSIGNNTIYGKISTELQIKSPDSPLKIRLRNLAKTISKIGYIGALLVSTSYLFSIIVIKNNFNLTAIINTIKNIPLMISYILYALTLSVTIIVVAVPEGLPMMITLVLSANMKKMLKNNVLVRKLVGIETAGNINVLFTDKTGTITKGNLEVVGIIDANQKTYTTINEIKCNNVQKLIKLNLYYNNASVIDDNKIIGGNMTDQALLKYITNEKIEKYTINEKNVFDGTKKFSSVTISEKDILKLVKGAPEIIINECKYYLDENGVVKLFTNKHIFLDKINKIAENGIRIIALAYSDQTKHISSKNNTFVSCILIKDDIRNEAKTGINIIKNAGIDVIMMTGDNVNTAMSIGRETGLITSNNDITITSNELNKMSDEEVIKILPNLKILARSTPLDKSRLINLSQKVGLVVGMTGDGINDAPALKKADVGFAMGSGTEIAKEASDIVILDDNLLSIANAISYGRTIFKSIRKYIIFQLTVNLCAVGLSIIGPFIKIDTPVTVIQMLWINMIMDTFAGVAFAYEPVNKEYMEELPKKKNEHIINKYMLNQIMITGSYILFICIFFLKSNFINHIFRFDNNNIYVLTAFFGLFIFINIFNAFNTRTNRLNIFSNIFKNKIFLSIILFIIIIQIILLYFGGTIFRTAGLTFFEFEIMIFIALTVIPIDFIRKLYLRKKNNLDGV